MGLFDLDSTRQARPETFLTRPAAKLKLEHELRNSHDRPTSKVRRSRLRRKTDFGVRVENKKLAQGLVFANHTV